MRLIDADLLYARVVRSSSPNLPARTKTTVQNMIDRAPTEDAVSREDFDVLRSNFNRQAKLLEEEHAKAVGKEGYGMSDYIKRADAIEAVAQEWLSEASAESPYVNDDDIGEYRKLAEKLFEDVPSAETHEIRTETHGVCLDLISRENAMGAVQDHFNADGFKGYDDGQKMMDRIKAPPSADAVRGEWIEREDWNGDYYYDCSVCGESFVLCDGTPSMNLYHFCPNCGARMKGGEDK